MRSVAVGGGRSVAVKPLRGEPVLRDLLREHFRGCRVVLVTGDVEAPLLEPAGNGWTVEAGAGAAKRWTTEKLIAALRKSRPFDNQLQG
jgi:hypothetical protein